MGIREYHLIALARTLGVPSVSARELRKIIHITDTAHYLNIKVYANAPFYNYS